MFDICLSHIRFLPWWWCIALVRHNQWMHLRDVSKMDLQFDLHTPVPGSPLVLMVFRPHSYSPIRYAWYHGRVDSCTKYPSWGRTLTTQSLVHLHWTMMMMIMMLLWYMRRRLLIRPLYFVPRIVASGESHHCRRSLFQTSYCTKKLRSRRWSIPISQWK